MVYIIFVCIFAATNAELLTVYINNENIDITPFDDNPNVGYGDYHFLENALYPVLCTAPNNINGSMRFEVKGDTNFSFPSVNTSSIQMLMKMRTKSDDVDQNFLDCYYDKPGVSYFVRIFLKPEDNGAKDLWMLQINQEIWRIPATNINFIFFRGEAFNISCGKIEASPRKKDVQTTNELYTNYYVKDEESIYCPNNIYINYFRIKFREIMFYGLQGLQASNILFWYENQNRSVIYYEYKDALALNMTWNVEVSPESLYVYQVLWKDKMISSFQGIKTNKRCTLSLTILISINDEDDNSVLVFKRSATGDVSHSNETKIIFREGTIPNVTREQDNETHLTLYIGIGLLTTLFVIFIIIISIIIKMKFKPPNRPDEDYGNLENDASTPPFPSQWDTYANAMDRTEPDPKILRQLYTMPVPKSQREANRCPSDVDEGFYSVVQQLDSDRGSDWTNNDSYVNVVR